MKNLKILFLGDLVGQPGLRALFAGLTSLQDRTGAHITAVNGENLAEGFGLLPEDAERLFKLGVSIITSGNHIWQRDDIYPILESEPRLLRPENYPPGVPGHGSVVVQAAGTSVAFLNLMGRERIGPSVDCPFRAASKAAAKLSTRTHHIIVDFHAEDVKEKEAMAYHLDGRVSAVLGTHTHVATTDERILPGGTAYITDLGMCGPEGSVIGTLPELSVRRSLTQLPIRMEVLDAPAFLHGVLLELDAESGNAVTIERIRYPWPQDGE
ncbi:MAG: TIGR00282 family metallophosphoesterase [Spirochaetaceae bacterium]|nr:TIGR00282 family metallophosphoesterase [Spirochaetaceae bacterium]MDT8297336.1 TIGR00282 family metallophosphoesterase [Spirochaetaceae bacterium]